MQTFEKQQEEQPMNIELESESGVFRMRENEEGEVTVELENKEGKKFVLNDMLPEGWKIVDYKMQTKVDSESKEIFINSEEVRYWGWEYLMDILHEIGHAVIPADNEKQKEVYTEFHSIRENYNNLKNDISAEDMGDFDKLHSKIERDAWAYAVKKLRSILEEMGMDANAVFSSREELKEHVHEALLTYKEWGMADIENMNASEKEKEKLLEDISKLYTYKDVKK